MDGLVRRLTAKGVESRQRGWFWRSPQHVSPRPLARVPHILEARSTQQFRDQLQLYLQTNVWTMSCHFLCILVFSMVRRHSI